MHSLFASDKRDQGHESRRLRMEQLEARYMLAAFDLLVFSKTAGYRHSSIEDGIGAIQALGAAHDFTVTATEDATQFNLTNLANYEAVVFLNTTGDVLDAAQQIAFEQYIQGGGGYVGIHAASDTEYAWNWYGDLVGAHFESHPAIQQATIIVADQVHPSTAHLPQEWIRTDEWYNFDINPRGDVHVLATLDESTYSGGANCFDHPITWYHDFDGGRSWYTAMGHTNASYSEQNFLDHILGGIQYAAGQIPSDGGAAVEDNYQKVELYGDSTDPMSLAVASDRRVFFVERGGAVKLYDPLTNNTSTIAQLDVYTGDEDGLLGIALDPQFDTNHWIYLFYSPSSGVSRQHVSRFTFTGAQLDLGSEQILLEIPTLHQDVNHSAGSLAFDPEGNLYISTGDNTNPFATDYAPLDERPGRSKWDAQKSASNADDLRGKILRIKPEADGTYSIPAGNLFPADGSAGRPEIYIMGSRNPFRISIDPETGWLYWGDVGPDADLDDPNLGPRGYDEINQARGPGNYGWPYIIADNKAYRDYDFDTGVSGPAFNPAAPVNDSPNNTGPQNLPPAESAFIWYPYVASTEFPELGIGGRTAMAGPVYHFDPNLQSSYKLPAYHDDTLFIYDWSRTTFFEVKLDGNGDVLKINPFLPETLNGVRAIDMEMGPDGALYILEWTGGFEGATGANLLRVEFLGSPQIVSADFDEDGDTDGDDFLSWQRGFGISGAAERQDGDANVDGKVDSFDLAIWEASYGNVSTPLAATPTLANVIDQVFAEEQTSLSDTDLAELLPIHLYTGASSGDSRQLTAPRSDASAETQLSTARVPASGPSSGQPLEAEVSRREVEASLAAMEGVDQIEKLTLDSVFADLVDATFGFSGHAESQFGRLLL